MATGTQGTPPEIFAVILAGGGGTRLWPASRRRRPKQLLKLGGSESLLAAAVRRAGALVGDGRTLVVTAADQAALIRAELPDLPAADVLVEPEPRNTAAAVGLAAVAALRRTGPDTVLAIFPADPHIGDEAAFFRAVRLAMAQARSAIVTIGLSPKHPETGFGYIKKGAAIDDGEEAGDGGEMLAEVFAVDRFVEKPKLEQARAYVASGGYLWNSGMFFLTAGRMLEESRRQLPGLGRALDAVAAAAADDASFEATVRAHYPEAPIISIDHGIMEHAAGIRVVPADFGWNDIGSWAALAGIRRADAAGNVVIGEGLAVHDARDSVVFSEPGAPFVGVVGVEGLVVVATADAVLVVPKARAQDVRKVVDSAKDTGRQDLL